MLPNACLLAKFGFDTAENEPSNVCPLAVPTSRLRPHTAVHSEERLRRPAVRLRRRSEGPATLPCGRAQRRNTRQTSPGPKLLQLILTSHLDCWNVQTFSRTIKCGGTPLPLVFVRFLFHSSTTGPSRSRRGSNLRYRGAYS